jgi:hypothetical protein
MCANTMASICLSELISTKAWAAAMPFGPAHGPRGGYAALGSECRCTGTWKLVCQACFDSASTRQVVVGGKGESRQECDHKELQRQQARDDDCCNTSSGNSKSCNTSPHARYYLNGPLPHTVPLLVMVVLTAVNNVQLCRNKNNTAAARPLQLQQHHPYSRRELHGG